MRDTCWARSRGVPGGAEGSSVASAQTEQPTPNKDSPIRCGSLLPEQV